MTPTAAAGGGAAGVAAGGEPPAAGRRFSGGVGGGCVGVVGAGAVVLRGGGWFPLVTPLAATGGATPDTIAASQATSSCGFAVVVALTGGLAVAAATGDMPATVNKTGATVRTLPPPACPPPR